MTRTIESDGYAVKLDLATGVVAVDLPVQRDQPDKEGRLEATLAPAPQVVPGRLISASVLAWKAKQFDDGLYAAVELAAQEGRGTFTGKRRLLESLAKALPAGKTSADLGNVPGVVFGACRLGGIPAEVPAPLVTGVEEEVSAFEANPLRSKPLGFYTWSDELRAIFRQDRMLQTRLKGRDGIAALAEALRKQPETARAYEQVERLYARLTNPAVDPDLSVAVAGQDVADDRIAILPVSRSLEGELVKKLFGNKPIPDGFDLLAEFTKRIRAGQIALEPTPASGWYDHQTWALEPLIRPDAMPEAARLRLAAEYRKQLEELFRGLLTLTRETHVKQLEIPAPAMAAFRPKVVIRVAPELAAEPLPTFYARRAASYAFVRGVLEEAFGAETLKAMKRVTATGTVEADLATEIDQMQALFAGAGALVDRQLGVQDRQPPAGRESDIAAYQAWAARIATDPDVGGDARVMVPVFYDRIRKQTKVWVVLGWSSRPVILSYAKPPGVMGITRDGKPAPADAVELDWDSTYESLWYPVMAEVYVTRVLDRDELRAVCDRHKVRSAILDNLK
jgi:hypothetical protein